MLNHYETLKAQKTGRYPDFYTALRAGKRSGGSSGEVEGVPPLTVRSSGVPIAEWQIWGNTVDGAGVGDIGKNIFSIFADHVLYNTNYYRYTLRGLDPTKNYACSTDLGDPYLINGILYFGKNWDSKLDVTLRHAKICKPNSDGTLYVYVHCTTESYCPNLYSLVVEGTRYIQVEQNDAATEYETYGIKVPITVNGSSAASIAVDKQLQKNEYLKRNADGSGILHHYVSGSAVDTPIVLPTLTTVQGVNVVDVPTSVPPEKIYLNCL